MVNKKKLQPVDRIHGLTVSSGLFLLGSTLLFHASTVLNGLVPDWFMLPFPLVVALVESILILPVWSLAAWKMTVWWHDRPRELRSFIDDPYLIS